MAASGSGNHALKIWPDDQDWDPEPDDQVLATLVQRYKSGKFLVSAVDRASMLNCFSMQGAITGGP